MHSKPLNYSKVMGVFETALSVKEIKQEKEKEKEEVKEDGKEDKEKEDTENEKGKPENDVQEEKEYEVKLVPILSSKHRLLFSQRRLDFLEDFALNISDVLKAQDEHARLKVEIKPSDAASGGSGSKTTDSRGGSKKHGQTNGTSTYGATGNSATYGAAHTNQYQQYGSRYNQHGSSGYPASSGYGSQYGQSYYGQSGYGGQTGSTGTAGSYGSSYGSSY
jgi:predicted nucleic acid-binding Zn ribbon protein